MKRKIIGVTVGSPLPKPNLKQTDPKKGDYVKGKDISPTKASQLENDPGYLTDSALPEAVNAALALAKASGEFDGEPGRDGKDGQDGYTPVKGIDYFDGEDGYTPVKRKDYSDGKDGYTRQKNVDYFDGKDGKDGAPGKDGKDGDAYVLTDADKAEIAELAADMVDVPGGGGFVASTEPPADTNLLWVDTDDNSGNDGGITDDHINALIDAKLGVIENGTY